MKVVLIAGAARNGKDQSANYLKDALVSKGKRVMIIHYADYLKYFCRQYLGWNGVKDQCGRELLQKYSTQIVRKNNSDTWVDIVISILKGVCTEYDYVLIPDVRFPNEIYKMKANFECEEYKIIRPAFDNGLTDEQKRHISETALDDYDFKHVILNCYDERYLEKIMKEFSEQILGE